MLPFHVEDAVSRLHRGLERQGDVVQVVLCLVEQIGVMSEDIKLLQDELADVRAELLRCTEAVEHVGERTSLE